MLIFVDSFGHYTDAFMPKKWDVIEDTSGLVAQSLTSGRFGGGGVTFIDAPATGSTRGAYIQKNYNGVSTIICGMALKQTHTQRTIMGGRWLTFLQGNTTQVGLDILESGQIRAVRSNTAGQGIFLINPDIGPSFTQRWNTLGISTDSISSSSFDFLEVKIVHHPTTGSIEIKRNGSAFWTLSNVNTAISGTNNSASVLVGGYIEVVSGLYQQANWLQAIISDFQLLNTTAGGTGDPVDFIGDRHWEPLFPVSDVTQDWTPDPGPNHFSNVNSFNPPDESKNNNTEGVNDIDNFDFESALGPTGATVMFSYTMLLEKNTGGAVGISGQSVSNALPSNGTEFQVPNPYAFRQSFSFIDPNTAAAWIVSGFNAAVHGYERTS